MESQRTFLFIGLLLVSFLLFQEWTQEQNQPQADTSAVTQQVTNSTPTEEQADVPASSQSDVPVVATQATRSVISITTDVLSVKIDTKGGDIVEANLLQHAETHGSDTPFMLLGEFEGKQYVSQSGLIGLNGPDANKAGRPVYESAQQQYELNGDTLRVPLTFTDEKGVQYTKTYVFKAGKYDVDLEYQVNNTTSSPVQVQLYTQIKRTINK